MTLVLDAQNRKGKTVCPKCLFLCQALCPTVPTHYLLVVSGNRCHDARCITQVKVQESEVTPQVRQLVSERGRNPPKSAQLFLLTLCPGTWGHSHSPTVYSSYRIRLPLPSTPLQFIWDIAYHASLFLLQLRKMEKDINIEKKTTERQPCLCLCDAASRYLPWLAFLRQADPFLWSSQLGAFAQRVLSSSKDLIANSLTSLEVLPWRGWHHLDATNQPAENCHLI